MSTNNNRPKEGTLRVWHIPQVPMRAFYVYVKSPTEAKKIIETLGKYDLFQFWNHIKPDFANASGLEVYQDGLWEEWHDEEDGHNIEDYDLVDGVLVVAWRELS